MADPVSVLPYVDNFRRDVPAQVSAFSALFFSVVSVTVILESEATRFFSKL